MAKPESWPADSMSDDELARLADSATDREWWLATGMCGGCAKVDCHRGKACTDRCKYCPARDVPGRTEV